VALAAIKISKLRNGENSDDGSDTDS
jgi:hypothetical protein